MRTATERGLGTPIPKDVKLFTPEDDAKLRDALRRCSPSTREACLLYTSQADLYRATPNIVSASLSPLFGSGTSAVTSVTPGSDGSGGLGAFASREGEQSLALFQPEGGGLADTPNSLDYPYGRREKTVSFFGSATYDVAPWLQLGVDASASHTVNNTGYSVFAGNLVLPSGSSLNPFHQDVDVYKRQTGTIFNVRTEAASELEVTVVEGEVQVRPSPANAAQAADPVRLEAGERLSEETAGESVAALSKDDIDDVVAWRHGKMVFDGVPLGEALARVAHYYGKTITVTPDVATVGLSGFTKLDNLDDFFVFLEDQMHDIHVTRTPDGGAQVSHR